MLSRTGFVCFWTVSDDCGPRVVRSAASELSAISGEEAHVERCGVHSYNSELDTYYMGQSPISANSTVKRARPASSPDPARRGCGRTRTDEAGCGEESECDRNSVDDTVTFHCV